MTAEENKKIADKALVNKIESEIDKAAKEGSFYYEYNDTLPKNIICYFLALGYRVYITLFEPSTIFDWSVSKDGIYFRPNAFVGYKNVDIEELLE